MGLYNFITGFRRAYKQRGLQPEQNKCFKTSYSSADQNVSYVYWFFNSPSKLHSKSNDHFITFGGGYIWEGRLQVDRPITWRKERGGGASKYSKHQLMIPVIFCLWVSIRIPEIIIILLFSYQTTWSSRKITSCKTKR